MENHGILKVLQITYFRVQKWTESIKPIIVKSIMRYEETEIDYFSFATAAEFYRLILMANVRTFKSHKILMWKCF